MTKTNEEAVAAAKSRFRVLREELNEVTARAGRIVHELSQIETSDVTATPREVLNEAHELFVMAQRALNLTDTAVTQMRGVLVPLQVKAERTLAGMLGLDEAMLVKTNCHSSDCPLHGHLNKKAEPATN